MVNCSLAELADSAPILEAIFIASELHKSGTDLLIAGDRGGIAGVARLIEFMSVARIGLVYVRNEDVNEFHQCARGLSLAHENPACF